MPQTHGSQYKRKPTGGTKRPWRGKRAFEAGSEPTDTTLGPVKLRRVGTFGGGIKVRIAVADWAILPAKASGKGLKPNLLLVIRNPPNVDYQRPGVINKGATVEPGLEPAKVTSRAAQQVVTPA